MLQSAAEMSGAGQGFRNASLPGSPASCPGDYFVSNSVNPNAIAAINNSMPCTTPIIGQKRSQRRTPSTNLGGSPMTSNNTTLNTSTSEHNSIFFSYNESRNSFFQASPSSTLNTRNSLTSCVSASATSSTTNSQCKVTIPKAPKPQRTLLIFENVIIGLNLSINDVKAKVADLTTAVTNGYNAMAKQLLQSEAYLRHLEQRVSTLNKLQNSYNVHLKMKDGIQNMYEAYKKSPGNQQKNLTSIKAGWKECIQKLCAIEAQTEALLGTFQFQIEKLIGFARLCPGDTYELQVKYGTGAKFRTRTKIAKDHSQSWDNGKFSFKITIHDFLSIRINEIKFLGKNLLIGERLCDTKDLFSTTNTQRLTLNANTSGTLKLSMLITWLPFENCEESFIYFNPIQQYLTINNKEKRLSSFTMTKVSSNGQPTTMNNNDILHSTLQVRPNSLNVTPSDKLVNTSVLSAIVDTDDTESESSAAVTSSSTSSSSSSASSTSKKIQDHQRLLNNTSLSSSSSSNKISRPTSNNTEAGNTTTSQHDESTSSSNLDHLDDDADDESDSNPSEALNESINSEVEKVLGSLLDNLVDNFSHNEDKLKIEQFNLNNYTELLFSRLQIKLDNLRDQFIELNEFSDTIHNCEILLNRSCDKSSLESKPKLLKETSITTEKLDLGLGKKAELLLDPEETEIRNVLDDVFQYFDFLDAEESDETSVQLASPSPPPPLPLPPQQSSSKTKLTNALLELSNEKIPADLHLFLATHLIQCNCIIDDLSWLNKVQTETGLRLNQLESIVFDRLGVETFVLKNFFHILVDLTEPTVDNWMNSVFKQIFNAEDENESRRVLWSRIVNMSDLMGSFSPQNSGQFTILCASRQSVLRNLSEHLNMEEGAISCLVNELIKHGLKLEQFAKTTPIHDSISLFQFCFILNFVQRADFNFVESELKKIFENETNWLNNKETCHSLNKLMSSEILYEIVLNRALNTSQDQITNLESLLLKMYQLDALKTTNALLSLLIQNSSSFSSTTSESTNNTKPDQVLKLIRLEKLFKILKNSDFGEILEFLKYKIEIANT